MSWWQDILGIKAKTDAPLTKASVSGPVEQGAYQIFSISVTDVGYGAVASANIDITGINAYMLKSTGGLPPNIAGITWPVFNKADGLIYVFYRFLPAEWQPGDTYVLQVSGITLHLTTGTFAVKEMDWGNVITGQIPAAEAEIVQDHFHNYTNVFGMAAAPTATHFGDRESLTPYHIISGNNAFGAALGIIGTADTPVRAGKTAFDPASISVTDVSRAEPYIIRFIWGTPAQTPAQAVAALQYSDSVVQQMTAAGNNKPQEVKMIRIPAGNQLWAEVKNATNLATVDFLLSMHEYPAP